MEDNHIVRIIQTAREPFSTGCWLVQLALNFYWMPYKSG